MSKLTVSPNDRARYDEIVSAVNNVDGDIHGIFVKVQGINFFVEATREDALRIVDMGFTLNKHEECGYRSYNLFLTVA